ncbi:MAG TPA: hypothetical protein VHB21_11225, partial [Minicystis sp.]|nr:hypothetical protein [Minicystis sp.]
MHVWERFLPVKAALLAAQLTLGAGCGGASAGRPLRANLSKSVDAQREFAAIVGDWARSDAAGRVALESRLIGFQEHYPDDELVRAADALLAWVELDRGDLDRAEVHAFRIQIAGPGEVSDTARVVQGAAVRRKGRAEEALALLAPLEG